MLGSHPLRFTSNEQPGSIAVVTKATKGGKNLTEAVAQAMGSMVGAQQKRRELGYTVNTVYGMASAGVLWNFLWNFFCLDGNVLKISDCLSSLHPTQPSRARLSRCLLCTNRVLMRILYRQSRRTSNLNEIINGKTIWARSLTTLSIGISRIFCLRSILEFRE